MRSAKMRHLLPLHQRSHYMRIPHLQTLRLLVAQGATVLGLVGDDRGGAPLRSSQCDTKSYLEPLQVQIEA